VRIRNSRNWLWNYALRPEFRISPSWKSIFCVPFSVFARLFAIVGLLVQGTMTRFRDPLRPELKIAAFLMYSGGATGQAVATQLGKGASTVLAAVKELSRHICFVSREEITFPTAAEHVSRVMQGFENIRGLPYCVGAIDGTHIKWLACPEDQFYEYRCYKGYLSIILFCCF